MKRIVIAGAVLGLVSSMAMAAPGEQAGKRRVGAMASPFFKTFQVLRRADTNGNKQVDIDEWIAAKTDAALRRFERLDTDDSATLSFEEFSDIHSRIRNFKMEHGEAVRACIDELQDEGANLPELPHIDEVAELEDVFADKDTNADGVLDIDEFTTALLARAQGVFDKLDANDDGVIVATEFFDKVNKVNELREAIAQCMKESADPMDELDDLVGEV